MTVIRRWNEIARENLSGEVWLPIIPDARVYDAKIGEWVDLSGAAFDSAVSSIGEMLDAGWGPPLLWEHEVSGGGSGLLQELRVVSQADAETKGVRVAAPRVLLGRYSLAHDIPRSAITYTSPSFVQDAQDDRGVMRSFILRELSLVSIPHLKTALPPAHEVSAHAWVDDGPHPGGTTAQEVRMSEEQVREIVLAAVGEAVAPLNARLDALESGVAMASPDAPEEMADPDKEEEMADDKEKEYADKVRQYADQLGKSEARIARLEKELAERKADEAVREYADRLPEDKVATLRDLHLRDRTAFDAAVSLIPEPAPIRDRAGRPGAGNVVSFSDAQPGDLAAAQREYMRKHNVSASEARAALRQGGVA